MVRRAQVNRNFMWLKVFLLRITEIKIARSRYCWFSHPSYFLIFSLISLCIIFTLVVWLLFDLLFIFCKARWGCFIMSMCMSPVIIIEPTDTFSWLCNYQHCSCVHFCGGSDTNVAEYSVYHLKDNHMLCYENEIGSTFTPSNTSFPTSSVTFKRKGHPGY
jgi:hypothetical protein